MKFPFEIKDGPPGTEWLSPDIEAGQINGSSFTVVPATSITTGLVPGTPYDFRVRVHNNSSSEDAVPWNSNTATGRFAVPVNSSSNGLVSTGTNLPGGITIASANGTRVQLIPAGNNYNLALQTMAGVPIATIAAALTVPNALQKIGIVYSPLGKYLVVLDFNLGSTTSQSVSISVYLTQTIGTLSAGAKIIGPGLTSACIISLPQGTFIGGSWAGSSYAGLGFAFAPFDGSLILTWPNNTQRYMRVLDLREKPFRTNRLSTSQDIQVTTIGQHLLSPGGELLALIPSQINNAVLLKQLPSGEDLGITYNGTGAGQLMLNNVVFTTTMNDPVKYGGISMTGMTTNLPNQTRIDPPFRATCAVQIHLWVATPAGTLNEGDSSNIKLPYNNPKASAYLARLPKGQSAEVIVVSGYKPPVISANDHRCAIAEIYSVEDVSPNEPKDRKVMAFTPLNFMQVAQRNLVIAGPNSPFFIAPYIVANYGDKPIDVKVRIEPVDPGKIATILPLKAMPQYNNLEVQGQGFIEYPCGRLIGRDEVKPLPGLELTLQPGDRFHYALLVDVTKEPDPKVLELAAFHIIEKRSDGTGGGATVLAVSNLNLIPSVTFKEPASACPVDLAADLYWSETSVAPATGRKNTIPEQSNGYLAGEIINRSAKAIDDLEIWLESHAIPGARIEPLVFQATRLEPGESMFAFWPISTGSFYYMNYPVSIVAQSPKYSPHRMLTRVIVSGGKVG